MFLSLNRGGFTFQDFFLLYPTGVCVPLASHTQKSPPFESPLPRTPHKLYQISTQFKNRLRDRLRRTSKIPLNQYLNKIVRQLNFHTKNPFSHPTSLPEPTFRLPTHTSLHPLTKPYFTQPPSLSQPSITCLPIEPARISHQCPITPHQISTKNKAMIHPKSQLYMPPF